MNLNKNHEFIFTKFDSVQLRNSNKYIEYIGRGKSPKYEESIYYTLNQKCIRRNSINLRDRKSVSKQWNDKFGNERLTKAGDILINSTGEGTIGRAAIVNAPILQGLSYDSHIILIRLNKNFVFPDYFVNIFNSSFIQMQIDILKGAKTTKQTELGINNVLKLSFPLPNLEKQIVLVENIQKKENIIRELEGKVKSLYDEKKKIIEEEILSES